LLELVAWDAFRGRDLATAVTNNAKRYHDIICYVVDNREKECCHSLIVEHPQSAVVSCFFFDGPLWLGVDACSTLAPNFVATNLLTNIGLEICCMHRLSRALPELEG
jgi:hypothetical protein